MDEGAAADDEHRAVLVGEVRSDRPRLKAVASSLDCRRLTRCELGLHNRRQHREERCHGRVLHAEPIEHHSPAASAWRRSLSRAQPLMSFNPETKVSSSTFLAHSSRLRFFALLARPTGSPLATIGPGAVTLRSPGALQVDLRAPLAGNRHALGK